MHIICPHCENPIEVVKLQARDEVSCPSCGSSFHLESDSTTDWKPRAGQKIGRFELLRMVGQGAFGTVYEARDPDLDRTVAVKVPRRATWAATATSTAFSARLAAWPSCGTRPSCRSTRSASRTASPIWSANSSRASPLPTGSPANGCRRNGSP